MSTYPKARWSVSTASVGASVWTRKLEDRAGEGGGYYLYKWDRTSSVILLEELVSAAGKEARQWPYGERSDYVTVDTIPVTAAMLEQDETGRELYAAQIIHADMMERFGPMAEWIGYGNDGKPVWFHQLVTS